MNILSQVQRLPGLQSSHLGLDTILGRDETIDFEDFLGVPEMSEQEVDTRAVLERQYGILQQTSSLGPPSGLLKPEVLPPREGVALPKNVL